MKFSLGAADTTWEDVVRRDELTEQLDRAKFCADYRAGKIQTLIDPGCDGPLQVDPAKFPPGHVYITIATDGDSTFRGGASLEETPWLARPGKIASDALCANGVQGACEMGQLFYIPFLSMVFWGGAGYLAYRWLK